jgi:glycosyltransferase involved in cell wall biosynthesis
MGVFRMSNQKICFCALGAYPLLSKTNISLIGGAEVQQALIAKELVKKGFDVSFIERDHGQKQIEEREGIKIFKTYPCDSPPGVQLYKLRSVWKALKHANADIYYARATILLFVIATFFCILRRKKLVYAISGEIHVDYYIKGVKIRDRFLYKFAIRHADCIIAQTKHQQELLNNNFDRDSVLIKSVVIVPEGRVTKDAQPTVLWVGTLKKELKKPETFLRLAKAIPNVKFQMIGGPESGDEQFYEKIRELASEISNLEFAGFVPYHEVDAYFAKAWILVNTSPTEGFSNTFLQAWARYTPVVSLNTDPDEIICKHKLGFHSGTFEQMVEDVKLLLIDDKLRAEMGMNGRRYVEKEHDIEKIVTEYVELFQKLR